MQMIKNQVDSKLLFGLEKGKIVFWTNYYRLRKHVGVELHSSWSMNYELNKITEKNINLMQNFWKLDTWQIVNMWNNNMENNWKT